MKLEQLPFEEAQFSRKTKFDQVLAHVAKKVKKNPKKGRLLLNSASQQVILIGQKLN
jgi:hypothetical protein